MMPLLVRTVCHIFTSRSSLYFTDCFFFALPAMRRPMPLLSCSEHNDHHCHISHANNMWRNCLKYRISQQLDKSHISINYSTSVLDYARPLNKPNAAITNNHFSIFIFKACSHCDTFWRQVVWQSVSIGQELHIMSVYIFLKIKIPGFSMSLRIIFKALIFN